MHAIIELQIVMYANFDNFVRNLEHPGRTRTSLGPTFVGIVAECLEKSKFLNPLASQARSHAHKIPLRSRTTFNHLPEESATRPISSTFRTPLNDVWRPWVWKCQEKERYYYRIYIQTYDQQNAECKTQTYCDEVQSKVCR